MKPKYFRPGLRMEGEAPGWKPHFRPIRPTLKNVTPANARKSRIIVIMGLQIIAEICPSWFRPGSRLSGLVPDFPACCNSGLVPTLPSWQSANSPKRDILSLGAMGLGPGRFPALFAWRRVRVLYFFEKTLTVQAFLHVFLQTY